MGVGAHNNIAECLVYGECQILGVCRASLGCLCNYWRPDPAKLGRQTGPRRWRGSCGINHIV